MLAPNQAQSAINCRFDRGTLRPLKALSAVQAVLTASNPLSIYKYGNYWFEWAGDVDAVPSPIGNDPYDRVFFTGDTYPRVTYNAIATAGLGPYPSNSYKLGIPAPMGAPSGVVGGTPVDPDSSPETRFYLCTYVDVFGTYGVISDVSNQLDVRVGETVTLTLPPAPVGNYNITHVRIWRTNTADGTGVFQAVADVPVGTGQYVDSILSGDLGEALPSDAADWDVPPDDMVGLVSMPGGFLAGFRKNEVLFSAPGMPHIWPVTYRKPVKHNVVGLGVVDNTLVVVTEGLPVLMSGLHPASMAVSELPIEQACVSKASIQSMPDGVIYASPDGLMILGPNRAELLTRNSFNREKWQALAPSTMRGAKWEGLYLCSYQVAGVWKAFIISPADPDTIVHADISLGAAGIGGRFNHLKEDTLYLAVDRQIQKWDAGSALVMTWKSRPFDLPAEAALSVLRVYAQTYPTTNPVTITLYRAGELEQATKPVLDSDAVRLGGAKLSKQYTVKITGGGEVDEVQIATTLDELKALQP